MDELRAGPEDDAPARFPRAVAEVDLLVEHEEARIEAADLVQHLTAHEHHRAHDEVNLAAGAVVEAAAVERVERAAARREPAEKQVLGRQAPERREAANRRLQLPVGVKESRPDDARRRFAFGEFDEALHGVRERPRVGVHHEEVPAGARALIPAFDSAAVPWIAG